MGGAPIRRANDVGLERADGWELQAAAAPAEGGRAEGGGGPRGARFWAGRRFGERTTSVWTLERADGWEVLCLSFIP